ncbi:MAG: AAA family ATPase, partial [bacterium]|nr:AAA family ATPase [bacterium]MCY4271991.1 AAA family ATPase [bacterium]
MPTADHVKALVRSHAEGDDTRFYSVALQVAARAARSGQS